MRVKLSQSKLILIISDNFDRKVCNEFGLIAVKFKNTIILNQFSSNQQAMLRLVQSVCKNIT